MKPKAGEIGYFMIHNEIRNAEILIVKKEEYANFTYIRYVFKADKNVPLGLELPEERVFSSREELLKNL
jgi:hypothetical protein